MTQNEILIQRLETSRAMMIAHLDEIDRNRKIYPLWTVREIIAHLSGWDDATIAFIKAIVAGEVPATPAARGIDAYNEETVATREGLDYDHIYREYLETRKVLLDLIRTMPEEKTTQQFILPWGDEGTLVDIIDIFGPHEEEHAEDVQKIIEEHKK
ncbi:MAG: ClbS/DfsB family four-helix bundle protein [Chloroflexi bacterium]|nr:ClbS/DfsB family four-helix bundle protein [Chloroflexota bacterium]